MKNIPNILTILRLVACPILIYFFIYKSYLWILVVFILDCLTDFFDGYLARKENYKSNFGKILDPIADKALVITICILLIVYIDIAGLHKIAFYIIILREIIVSLLRMNLENKNKSIDVNQLSKYKTFIQMLAIGSILIQYVFPKIFLESISYFLIWLAAFVTFLSGFQHVKTYLKLK